MADTKISGLPASTTPLAGTEVLPIVQSGVTRQVSVANLTAGRAISATQLTLTTGNLIVANGQGVDFSATPGTGTSELLADYEEGTWTPVIARSGGGLSYTPSGSDVGFYTKVGRQVTVTCSFGGTWTGGSGDYEITGLPFTVGGALYTRISTAIINNSAANTLGQCWPVTSSTKLTSFDTFVSGNICSTGGVYFV